MIQLGLFGDDKEVKAGRKARPFEQPMLFSAREILQFGVRAHPLLPLSPKTALELVMEDPRTEAEKERDRERAAQRLTQPLIDDARYWMNQPDFDAEYRAAFPERQPD